MTNDFWMSGFKGLGQHGLQLYLIHNNQIAGETAAAHFVQRDELSRVNMNDQGNFAQLGLLITLWAFVESFVCVRIQEEIVPLFVALERSSWDWHGLFCFEIFNLEGNQIKAKPRDKSSIKSS